MKHILTLAVLALSVSSASFFAAPDAVAQDSSANEAKSPKARPIQPGLRPRQFAKRRPRKRKPAACEKCRYNQSAFLYCRIN